MIVKWLKQTGNGSARATVDYMLGKNRDRDGATAYGGVARAEHTALLADSLKHKHKYAVGVLSFEEAPASISDTKKIEIMESFERTIFAGLDREQYNIAWIEHTDKGRLELNFIIPKVELRSGRAMNPYLHGKDTQLIDTWKNIINAEHGLSDPNDPAKRHTTTHRQRLPKDKRELAEAIDESITIGIKAGDIKDRAGVIEHIESFGLSVTKTTKQSISVHNEDMGKRPLRLTGAYYEQDFESSSIDQEYIEARSAEHRARAGERLRADKEEYQRLLGIRSGYNKERYSSPVVAVSSDQRRRSRSSDRPSIEADRPADRAITAADQRAIERTRSADSAGHDRRAEAGSFVGNRAVVAHEKSGQQYRYAAAEDATRLQQQLDRDTRADRQGVGFGGITALECREDDRAAAASTETTRRDFRQDYSDSTSDRQRIGRDVLSNFEKYSYDRARSGTRSTEHSTTHERPVGEHQQNNRQHQRINDSQAIPAHISPHSNAGMGADTVVGDNDRQLQHLQQSQDSEHLRYTDKAEASDIGRPKQADSSSAGGAAGQFGDDRTDTGRHQNQITTPTDNRDHQQQGLDFFTGRESIANQEITEHGRTIINSIRATFSQFGARIRRRVAYAIGHQRDTASTDRFIDGINADIERRKQFIVRTDIATSDRDHGLTGSSSQTAARDRAIDFGAGHSDEMAEYLLGRAEERARDQDAVQRTDRNIKHAERQIIDTDRDITAAEQRTSEQSQHINWINNEIQSHVQRLEAEKRAEQQREAERLERIRLAELEEERQREANNEYSSPTPFD